MNKTYKAGSTIGAAAIIVLIMIGSLLLWHEHQNRQPIQFYRIRPVNYASDEVMRLANGIYESHEDVLTHVKLSVDTRSNKVIQFALISDEPLPEAPRKDILGLIYSYIRYCDKMELKRISRDGEWPAYYSSSVHTCPVWEVFFCTPNAVCCAYVARLDTDTRYGVDRPSLVFTDWEEVPNIKEHMSMEMLENKFSAACHPMYRADSGPITDQKNNLPPY